MPNADGGRAPAVRMKPRRAVRPCDSCRRRKARCVMPTDARSCTVCCSRNLPCTFEEKPPLRTSRSRQLNSPQEGQPTTSALNTLLPAPPVDSQAMGMEAPLSLPFSESPVRRSESLSATRTDHLAEQPADNDPGQYQASQTPLGRVPGPYDGINNSLGLARSKFAELYGLTSDMEPILMVCCSIPAEPGPF